MTANNIPDLLANEQTWPTEEEMMSAPNNADGLLAQSDIPKIKRVPKGTSAYQAAWIVDDADQDDNSDTASNDDGFLGSEAVGDASSLRNEQCKLHSELSH